MNLTGVFINSGCVFFAGILGSLFKKGLSEKVKDTLMVGLGPVSYTHLDVYKRQGPLRGEVVRTRPVDQV